MMDKVALVLASGSPRRLELLRAAGFVPEVLPAEVEELKSLSDDMTPGDLVEQNARLKARAVAKLRPEAYVLAADTVVSLKGDLFGKPADAAEALEMLESLSGQEHSVFTGVALMYKGRLQSRQAETKVRFRELTTREIIAYAASGEPLDKAGGYAIQGGAASFVESIDGDMDNVIGLPMRVVEQLMAEMQKSGL